jgi:glutamine amidotransferase-like uncharacterized protein
MVWPEVGIYVGEGASHSWTWFADIFDQRGIYSVRFIDEAAIADGALDAIDVLFISGGDTFAIAEGLGSTGAAQLEAFITAGGVYIGSCAGAYLPLKSSIYPLNQFNLVTSRITNLTKNLPAPKQMAEKFCTEYGCRYVFHPVREEVRVKIAGGFSCAGKEMRVPLYGGPAMTASDDIEVLAYYTGFTDKTEFLVDREVAEQTLIGNVAIARKRLGQGVIYLLGPHFEHPHYPSANSIIYEAMLDGYAEPRLQPDSAEFACDEPGIANKNLMRAFKSEISNGRIVALALERKPLQWLIGKKVYDPEKIRVFLEAVWSRISVIDRVECMAEEEGYYLLHTAQSVTTMLKTLKNESDAGHAVTVAAEELFAKLKALAAAFLTLYFKMKELRSSGVEGFRSAANSDAHAEVR